ncbi:hypothetical protein Tco_1445457, partial [Tanacetum coccineum]
MEAMVSIDVHLLSPIWQNPSLQLPYITTTNFNSITRTTLRMTSSQSKGNIDFGKVSTFGRLIISRDNGLMSCEAKSFPTVKSHPHEDLHTLPYASGSRILRMLLFEKRKISRSLFTASIKDGNREGGPFEL